MSFTYSYKMAIEILPRESINIIHQIERERVLLFLWRNPIMRIVVRKRVLKLISTLSTLAHFAGFWSLRSWRMTTRAIPVTKARRAECNIPRDSLLREARRLTMSPAMPTKWSPRKILRASSIRKHYPAWLWLSVILGR